MQATARPGVIARADRDRSSTEEIARLAKTGPTAAELERAKTKQEFAFVSGLEAIGGFGGKADLLNQYNTFLGDPGKFDADLARYRTRHARATCAHAVDKWLEHAQPRCSCASIRKRRAAPTSDDARSLEGAGARRGPAVQGAGGADREARQRPRDLRRRAPRSAEGRGDARARAPARPPIRPGRPASRTWSSRTIDMGTKTRKALRDRGRARRSRHVARRRRRARERAASASKCSEAQPARRRSAIVADVVRNARSPEAEVDAREEAPARRARAAGEERRTRSAARVRADARLRRRIIPTAVPAQGLPSNGRGDDARRSRRLPRATTGSPAARRWSSSAT